MMSKSIRLVLPIFFFASFMVAHAQWSSDPAVNNVICRAAENQSAPRIISDGKGGAIICWHDQRATQNYYDVYAQRIDKDGFVRWTVNGVVVSAALYSQSKPDMVSDDAGGAIIAWTDNRNGDNDIYVQRIDSSGKVLWTPDGVAVTADTSNQADVKITTDGKHGAIVTWNAGTGGFPPGSKIYAQRIDANGTLRWNTPTLVSGTLRFANAPTIASDGKGGAFIAYAYYPRPEYDVYAQRVDSNGAVLWENKGVGIATGSGSQDSPILVADGAGNAFLGYSDWGAGSIATLNLVVLKKDGTQAAAFRATSTSGGQLNGQLSNIGVGLLGVAWDDGRVAGKRRVFAQIIDTTGKKYWAADGVAVSSRAGDQVAPYVISDGNGGVIVAWEDKTGGLKSDIYAQRLSDAGATLWPGTGAPVCTAANIRQFPWMISDGHNGAIVTWEDYRPSFSNAEVYASRILADGSFPIAPPILTFSSKTVAFGNVGLGYSSTKNITLTNGGGAAVTIASVTSSDPQFTLTPESNTIAPAGNVTAEVKYKPTSKNTVSARIVIQSNSVFGPDTITVTGTGTAAAEIETDRKSLNFGNVVVGSTKSLALNISNTGNDTLKITSIATSNPKFTVETASKVILPGESFVDSIRFSPTASGPASADLTLTSNALTSPTVIPLSGTGSSEVTMTINLADISFGNVPVGASKDTTVTITNTGSDTLRIASFTAGDSHFTMETPITVIAPAGVKTFTLRFAPDAVGPLGTAFTVTSNAISSPNTINVDGTGVADPAIAFAPPQLSFGSVDVGSKKDLVLTINNTGSMNLTVTAITSSNADFSALVQQFEVPGGGSFVDTIRFTPSLIGDRNGVLTILSNAATSPDNVPVDGTGKDVSPVHPLDGLPGTFTLFQNYPNPFNPSTSIAFSIPSRGDVRLSVFDHLGREIAVLADGLYQAGSHTCRFDAAEHASGMYVYRLSWNGNTVTRTMLLLR
ncbi:MAG: choice-of-anchor D domain-containing protein [Bacteroidetes bacterium]|nr:choice-of-anchor D domain-containing protein [Bacteroidota bacterium]